MKKSTIEEILKDSNHFLGCFSKSNLPPFPKIFPKGLIINNNDKEFPHWIAIVLLENNCLYFDSFGYNKEYIENEIVAYLQSGYNRRIKVVLNSKRIQTYASKNCAEYCIAFIKNVTNEENFVSFLKQFEYMNRYSNDNYVKYLF